MVLWATTWWRQANGRPMLIVGSRPAVYLMVVVKAAILQKNTVDLRKKEVTRKREMKTKKILDRRSGGIDEDGTVTTSVRTTIFQTQFSTHYVSCV